MRMGIRLYDPSLGRFLQVVIDTAGIASYPLPNGHGDIAGVTDATGIFVANPAVDEYGKGGTNGERLGWLGSQQRYTAHTGNGLMRMGVRLYDPNLGRFLSVDPVSGGSANDYEYCNGDPVNCFDLNGENAIAIAAGGAGAAALCVATCAEIVVGVAIVGTAVAIGAGIKGLFNHFARASKKTGKETASDRPRWVTKEMGRPRSGETSPPRVARRIMRERYPNGYKEGPGSEYE